MAITLPQGNMLHRQWTLFSDTGAAVDLTGCIASFGIITILGVSIFQATSADETGYLTIQSPTTGVVVLAVPCAVTGEFPVPSNGVNMCRAALKVLYTDDSSYTYDIETMKIIREVANVE
jgi:hypothetical protein